MNKSKRRDRRFEEDVDYYLAAGVPSRLLRPGGALGRSRTGIASRSRQPFSIIASCVDKIDRLVPVVLIAVRNPNLGTARQSHVLERAALLLLLNLDTARRRLR
jgi:hypothetical protein